MKITDFSSCWTVWIYWCVSGKDGEGRTGDGQGPREELPTHSPSFPKEKQKEKVWKPVFGWYHVHRLCICIFVSWQHYKPRRLIISQPSSNSIIASCFNYIMTPSLSSMKFTPDNCTLIWGKWPFLEGCFFSHHFLEMKHFVSFTGTMSNDKEKPINEPSVTYKNIRYLLLASVDVSDSPWKSFRNNKCYW